MMKTPAMIEATGDAVYILDERPWATESGTITQCAIATPGKYADNGIATGWIDAEKLIRLQ